jgi:photosystem II stability/assembly factor-like uncharacterized protein
MVLLVAFCAALAQAAAFAAPVNWLPFGPDGGDARRIVPDPSDHSHLFLGTVNGWIYESHDTGGSWRRLARIDKRDDLVLDSIVVDAKNPKHLIIGAWVVGSNDGGLFISYDAGKNWINQAEMRGQSIRALRASPTDPNELVAGTLKGVFRSSDGGQRWHLISPRDSTEIHEVQSVAIDPTDPNIIYAGTWHLPWKTTDGGEHWENIKEGIIDDSDVFSILVDPQDPKIVYASACSGIYKSEDAAALFHKIQGIPSSARRTRVLMQDPNDLKIVFAGTTEGLFRSNDAGKTWNRTTGPEIIVNDVSVDQSDSKHVLIATNRGGVLASEDGGDTFHTSNAGFSARQITAMRHDRGHAATILIGVVNDKEWGGVFRSDDGGLSWAQKAEGLQGRDVFAIGQAPDGTFIAGTAHGLFRLDHETQTWVRVENAPSGNVAAEPNQAEIVRVRGEVPIGSNHFPHRSGASHPALQKKPARSATKSKTKPGVRKVAGSSVKHMPSQAKRALHAAAQPAHAIARVKTATVPSGEAPPPDNAAAPLPTEQAAIPTKAAAGSTGFDGGVYGIVTSMNRMLAITSVGLLASEDNGLSWTLSGPEQTAEWRYLSAAKQDIVAASLHTLSFSADCGQTWSSIIVPAGLTQIGAVAVEPSGRIWVGGREGVFVSSDAGGSWMTPKNLFVNSVNSIFYDESDSRMMVTTGGYSSIVFLVQLPDLKVSFADTGWSLRFARPVGDHLLAATLFDGIVIEPKMVASPMQQNAVREAPADRPSSDSGSRAPTVAENPAPARSPRTIPATGPTLGTNGVPVVEPVHLPTSPQ